MNNSYQWIDAIIAALFTAEKRRLDRSILEITRRNNEIKGGNHPGFMHRGVKHIAAQNYPQYVANRSVHKMLPSVAFELMSEVSTFTIDKDKVDGDEAQIRQLLFKLLVNCNDLQDIRNSLPDCIVNILKEPKLRALKRTLVDPCYHIRSDYRAMKMYEKLLPKIEMYSVAQMLY